MKIIGNTVGTPTPRSNWAQNDPTKADYIKNKPKGLVETPVFDLSAMGMVAIPLAGGFSSVDTDATEIITALEKGAVAFVIPVDLNGATMNATVMMNGANAGGAWQCISVVNYTGDTGTIKVVVQPTSIAVEYRTLKSQMGIPSVTEEDNGKILQVVDGSWSAVAMLDVSEVGL